MNLSLIRDDIIDGMQKATSIIPAKTGAAYLRTLWLEASGDVLRVFATDASLEFVGEYPSQVGEAGLTGVSGRNFNELVRKLPAGQIGLKLDQDSGNLRISQGSRKYRLPISDKTWFQPFAPFPETGVIPWSGDFLQEIIDRVLFCVSDEDTMEAMNCLHFKPTGKDGKIDVCGLNGHQFALVTFANDDIHDMLPSEGILIQKKYVQELKRFLTTDDIELALGQKRLYFRTADKRESLSLPLSAYQYPDYTSFVGKLDDENISVLNIDRLELTDSLERVLIFNNDNNRCAFFTFSSESELSLQSQGQEAGEAAETLPSKYAGDLPKIAFPTRDLIDILGHFNSSRVIMSMTGAEGPCGVSGEDDPDYLVIIMPMKIVEETYYSEEYSE